MPYKKKLKQYHKRHELYKLKSIKAYLASTEIDFLKLQILGFFYTTISFVYTHYQSYSLMCLFN